jgi:uncharacterized membrane protein
MTAVTASTTTDQHHPVVDSQKSDRHADLQLRVADAITKFAGSMMFVYIHVVIFAIWMVAVEIDPWPKLTLVVSLEAIFLSTFVMIGQNRQAEFAQRKADHDYTEEEAELHLNTDLTKTIHELTKAIHEQIVKTTAS